MNLFDRSPGIDLWPARRLRDEGRDEEFQPRLGRRISCFLDRRVRIQLRVTVRHGAG